MKEFGKMLWSLTWRGAIIGLSIICATAYVKDGVKILDDFCGC